MMKRKIEGLSNNEEVTSSHIQQLTPRVFAIGSVFQTETENPEIEAVFRSCFHLVCGDFSDLKKEFRTQKFEIPFSMTFDPKKPVIFRTLHVKEKYQ